MPVLQGQPQWHVLLPLVVSGFSLTDDFSKICPRSLLILRILLILLRYCCYCCYCCYCSWPFRRFRTRLRRCSILDGSTKYVCFAS